MYLPETRFLFSWHLNPLFERLFQLNKHREIEKYPSPANIKKKIADYEKEWKPLEKALLEEMCSILELEFYQNVIDIHVVGYAKPFSSPLVLSSHYKADDAVDVLTHELLHRLLTDNTKQLNVSEIWSEMFEGEERLVRNHVLVHAMHEFLYRKVLKDPSRLKRDQTYAAKHPAYKRSWAIVTERGYEKITEDFKKKY